TAEVFRPAPSQEAEASIERDPQGLRRPRFSFFNLTCQTARRRCVNLPEREKILSLNHPTTDQQPTPIGY
ncbi:hypothetical protein, partial [Tardiphaga robiniae]|uniref:hypothetical protein n=1 Tax=Tardiphaga robiniae TaxID=943830 RepID=UPI001AEDBB62